MSPRYGPFSVIEQLPRQFLLDFCGEQRVKRRHVFVVDVVALRGLIYAGDAVKVGSFKATNTTILGSMAGAIPTNEVTNFVFE